MIKPSEIAELRHRLNKCEKAAEFYQLHGVSGSEGRDILFLYETLALLGRKIMAEQEPLGPDAKRTES